jgi:SH3-like domain-containing protein
MSRKGMITPAPKIIHGKKFDVRYSSLIARAQRMSEGQDFIRAINVAAPIINAKPEALDNLNPDAALKYVFSLHGVPSKVFNTAKQVQQIRDGRANAQQKAAEMQDAQHQADVAGKVMPGAAQMMQAQNQKG